MTLSVIAMSGLTVAPAQAAATSGDLIKMEGLSSVYYLGEDGKRYVFPNESTYFSWYSDFSGVVTITASELQSYHLGGNVTVRPGTTLVKITTDPSVYAVEANGVLRKIQNESQAAALYGTDWNQRIIDLADSFFTNYTIGQPIADGEIPAGTLVKVAGDTSVYYYDGTNYRSIVSEAAMNANRFRFGNVIVIATSVSATGTPITGMEAGLVDTSQGATGPDQVITGSGLMVSLNSQTPVSMSIPYNVQNFVYTSVNFTASNDGPITLTGLTVERKGLGFSNSFDYVYAEVDGQLKGSKRTLGSSNQASLYFSTDSSKIVIPAGETVTVDLVADMADSNFGGQNALSIVSASAVTSSGATVTGSFPIMGNLMSTTDVPAATATFTIDSLGGDVYLGDDQVEVARFEVGNTSDVEHISFSKIILENLGTADQNEVINYTLYSSGNIVAGPVNANSSDKINFALTSAMEIQDNSTEDFVVKADIYDGRTETVILNLDEVTELKAMGLNNGFTTTNEKTGTAQSYEINGGDISLSVADSNPGDDDVAPKDSNVLFLAANIESLEEMMVITGLTLGFDASIASSTSIENVTVYLDGNVVAGPKDFTADTATTTIFDENFEVNGTQLLEVKADIADDAVSGNYYFTLDSTDITAEDAAGDVVANARIKGDVTGGTITVATGDVSLAIDATYGSRSLVAGSDDLLVGQFVLEVNDAEGVKIDQYVVDVAVDDQLALTDINELYISEDTDVITSVIASGNTFNVNQELAAGTTKIVKVYASVDDFTLGSTDSLQVSLTVSGEGVTSREVFTQNVAVDGQEITFVAGSLTESISAGTTDSAIVIAGSQNVAVAEWEYESENVGYTLKDVKVTVYATSTAATTTEKALVTDMTLNGQTATAVNGVATFSGPFTVEKDGKLKLSLSASFNGDFNSIDSGDVANFAITEYKYKAANKNTYSTESVTDKSLATDEVMYVRNTVPYILASAGPTITLKTLSNDIMLINVEADAHDDVTIGTTTISLISGGAATGTVALLDSNNIELGSVDFASSTSAQELVLGWNDEIIAAGQSETYTVRVSFASAPAANSTLSVELVEALSWNDGEATLAITANPELIHSLQGSFEINNK